MSPWKFGDVLRRVPGREGTDDQRVMYVGPAMVHNRRGINFVGISLAGARLNISQGTVSGSWLAELWEIDDARPDR